jgi:hypothetical protein
MNIVQALQAFQQMKNNPQQLLQRFGIPQSCNSPESVAQYLLDNGKVTQEQIQQAKNFFNSNAQR